MQHINLTLVFVTDEERILLGMKKRGFGAGKWNGFGGKVEQEECPESAAYREVEEEISVTPSELYECGTLEFIYEHTQKTHHVTVYRTSGLVGTPAETDEMRPQWFSFDTIPYESMWVDDPLWFPLLLAGKRFKGTFYFSDDDTITKHEVVAC